MAIKYCSVIEFRDAPVKRKAIRIGKDAAAQNFAAMFGTPTKLPGQDDEGYGSKITTDREALVRDPEGKRNPKWYRVYATCYGNASSHWVRAFGSRYYIQ